MAPETFDRIVSAIVAAATAFVVVEARHALPVIRRGRWRLAVALAVGMGAAGLAALGTAARDIEGDNSRPYSAADRQPAPPPTVTLTVTPTTAIPVTETVTPFSTATPTATLAAPTPSQTPPWVSIRTDASMRVQYCTGLSKVDPTPGTLPALDGCVDVVPYTGAPTASVPGQWYLLWPSAFVYRIIPVATPWPGWCEPQVIVVTATPPPTDTPTPTITPNAIATYVAGTLTALAPTATGTSRPTDTRVPMPLPEATPTPRPLILFPVLQFRPPTVRPR